VRYAGLGGYVFVLDQVFGNHHKFRLVDPEVLDFLDPSFVLAELD
jgi:hypothetical protein